MHRTNQSFHLQISFKFIFKEKKPNNTPQPPQTGWKMNKEKDDLEDLVWTDSTDMCMFFSHTAQLNFSVCIQVNYIYPLEKVDHV